MSNEPITAASPLAGVLAELEPRQVAHDQIDRQAWLRARLSGCTATEAKVMHKGSTSAKAAALKEKIEGGGFTGNKYTDWGSYREAHLMQAAAATSYGWLVHAPGQQRHLATPDGLRKTWTGFAIVEGKTGKHDISIGSKKFEEYGYLWQMLWQMYCVGTDEAYYVWEQHDDDWSRWAKRPVNQPELWAEYGPKPIRLEVEHFVITPELKAEQEKMVLAVNRFLGRLDKRVAELRAEASGEPVEAAEPVEVVPGSPEHEAQLRLASMETQAKLYRKHLEAEKVEADAKAAALAEVLSLSIKHWGGEGDAHEFPETGEEGSPVLRIGYTASASGVKVVPDPDAAKAAQPQMWEAREKARLAFEQADDQWKTHQANHTKTTATSAPAKVGVTQKAAKK